MRVLDSIMKALMYRLKLRTKSKHVAAFVLRNSPHKLWNFIKVSAARHLGKSEDFGFPYILVIEPTNRCNLKCGLCPTGKGLVGRPKQNMSMQRFRCLIDEIGKYLYVINYQNWGEPTLAKELPEMIRYAYDNNIFTCVATNGHYKRSLNDAFINSHLDHITFAVDGSDNATYSEYRHGGNLSVVLNNIRDLLNKRNEKSVGYPFVELQFLVFEHNFNDINNIRILARDLGVDGLLIRAGESPVNEKALERYYTWDTEKHFCSRFWYTATIASDGGVAPCCNYFYRHDDFGNISESSFKEVWNNENFRKSRAHVSARCITKLPNTCKSCKIYNTEQAHFPIWNPDR